MEFAVVRPACVKATDMTFVLALVFFRVINLVICGKTISFIDPRDTVEEVT